MNPMKKTLARLALVLSLALGVASPAASQAVCNNGDDGYLFSWNGRTWTGGATATNQWTVNRPTGGDPVTLSFRFTGSTGRFVTNYPAISSLATGGLAASTQSLLPLMDFATTSETVALSVGFSREVYNVTVPMFDVDTIAASGVLTSTGGFRDNATFAGTNTVAGNNPLPSISTPFHSLPTTTNPSSTVELFTNNTGRVRGVNGDAPATSNVGNASARFNQPITSFTWVYGNSGITTSNPAQQAIAIHDISFCVPRFANVKATKTVKVHRSDAVSCNVFPGTPQPGLPAAIPGACMEYTIQATNTGAGPARGVNLSDVLTPNHIFRGAQITGFPTTPSYTFTAPANNTSCGGTACTVSLTNATLAPGATGTIRIRAEIK